MLNPGVPKPKVETVEDYHRRMVESYKRHAEAYNPELDLDAEARKILNELNIKITARDILALLEDESRLKAVLAKLKLKAYW